MYKMIAYNRETGDRFFPQFANNIQWFDKYKNKDNYRIEIYKLSGKKYKLIYKEARYKR